MANRLVYRPSAEADLASIYDWIADEAGPHIAFGYVSRIEDACEALLDFPGRGTPRNALAPGLRSLSFEQRATIYYVVIDTRLEIVRVLRAGRDVERAFQDN